MLVSPPAQRDRLAVLLNSNTTHPLDYNLPQVADNDLAALKEAADGQY